MGKAAKKSSETKRYNHPDALAQNNTRSLNLLGEFRERKPRSHNEKRKSEKHILRHSRATNRGRPQSTETLAQKKGVEEEESLPFAHTDVGHTRKTGDLRDRILIIGGPRGRR